MKPFVCFVIFYLIFTYSHSQDSLKKDGIIYYKWLSWKLDGKRLSPIKLKEEIYSVQEAIPYYQKSKTKKILAYSLVSSGLILIYLSKNNDILSVNYPQPKYGFLISGSLSTLAGSLFALRSSSLLKQSVKLRNEKIMTGY